MPVNYSPYKVKFKSSQTIYQQDIVCRVNENEFNMTLNPSIATDTSGSLRNFATGSDFEPYVTTVGLYNESNELLVVGKLAQPFRLPSTTDTTFIIRYDF